MNKCYITEIEGISANSNLSYVNDITLKITKDDSNQGTSFEIDNKESIVIESIGGNHLSATKGGVKTNTITIPAHNYGGTRTNVYYDNDDYVIKISKKYISHIRYMWLGGSKICSCNISQFAYCMANSDVASSVTLHIGGSSVYGSIEELSNIDMNCTVITAINSNISGNIIGLSKNMRLNNLIINNTNIDGSLEGFAAAMVANGRTSGTLNVVCSAFVTLNGALVGNNVTKTIIFDNSVTGGYSIS